MRKADSLRAWLAAWLPDLVAHPDRLSVYVEGGTIVARQSPTLSFAYAYTLKIGLWDFAGSADLFVVPLLAWLETEQPQLLRRADSTPFSFRAELLDGDRYDFLIDVALTENVLVHPRPDGSGFDVEHSPEPDFTDSFDGAPATFRQGFGNAELLLAADNPDG